MAVDGWSSEGTPRLICSDPPGGDGGDGGDGTASFTPNVLLGFASGYLEGSPNPYVSSVNMGTADFSMEMWSLRKYVASPGNTATFDLSGIHRDATGSATAVATLTWNHNGSTVVATFRPPSAATVSFSAAISVLGHWEHYAVNYDRDGNMELFINAVSAGTASIAALSANTILGTVHPYSQVSVTLNGAFNNWSPIAITSQEVGPFAIHSRLMTQAEMENSYRNKKVQNIASVSTLVYYWDKIERETGWDVDMDNLMLAYKAGLKVPAASPEGVLGTVIVPDQSGNGNNWPLSTAADYSSRGAGTGYSTAGAGKWAVAFGSDPFFR